jgi:hypothetical protein
MKVIGTLLLLGRAARGRRPHALEHRRLGEHAIVATAEVRLRARPWQSAVRSTSRARAMPMRWRWPPENWCG